MATFYMLIGLPASGKSNYVKDWGRYGDTVIVSSDAIRAELWGDERVQREPEKVFQIAHERILNALENDIDVVFDATNIKRKNRMSILNKIKQSAPSTWIVGLLFIEPYHILCNRNRFRERQVPEEVIWRMMTQFEIPLYSEGFNDIKIIDFNKQNSSEYLNYMINFNQHNSHHSYDLYTHCIRTAGYIEEEVKDVAKKELLSEAAIYHDIGKLFTQTFTNLRGEASENAHYYGHQNVGAYLYLTFCLYHLKGQDFVLKVSQLICYHMQPYFNKTDKAKEKWKNILGEELYSLVQMLHEADKNSH